ncbi:Uncharacterised protein [Halioglobus japonicus]|nr:Uncharacterised protein [Halioglobus japonicus]
MAITNQPDTPPFFKCSNTRFSYNSIISDPDLTDFFIANGGFSNNKYELLSYITDDKKHGDSSEYLNPIGALPPSESEGLGELRGEGNCFTNAPGLSYEYIERQELEDQLFSLLKDDRRTVVTLLGRGGIGKTSLALRVLPRLYETTRFDAVIWFSSRDIDLQMNGAKLVSADVISEKDISRYYSGLVLSDEDSSNKTFDPESFFQKQLTESDIGPCLFVFDNFETTQNPIEVFRWIDTYIRGPNKILITTRLREFKGDYPINVHGMTEKESEELARLTASQLGVEKQLSSGLIDTLYKVSEGHPYIIKILLGELSKNQMKGSLPKIVASSEEVLTALFERTYSTLNPCAQRVFLTLASWNSAVSRLVLEAVLMAAIEEPLEVERAIDTLIQYSLAEEYKSKQDGEYFLALPFTAMSFGKRKLSVSPLKIAISVDVRLLQMFGPDKVDNKHISLAHHVSTFLASLNDPLNDYKSHQHLLERIGMSYPAALPITARWLEESGDSKLLEESKNYLYRFLEVVQVDTEKASAWNSLAEISRKLNLHFDEVHALIEASQFTIVDFSELSNVVNRVNHKLGTHELVLDNKDTKTELLSKIYDVVWKRKTEGDANDYSRLAWLALHLNKTEDAHFLTDCGLEIDPENRHCQKLKQKLEKVPHI